MATVESRWIRNPSDELAIAQGCYFEAAAGEFVCDFIEKFCRQSKGRWGGEPLRLLDWQRDFLMRLFGWKRPDESRRFRRAYLEVGKKNGKSTLASALTIVFLLADHEAAPEVYCNAVDREQASIIYEEAARMVRASPDLQRRLDIVDSRKRIIDPAGNGKIVANSADVASKDGVNASATLFDELHRQKTREMWDIFRYAGASRVQPLTVSITTAGESEDGVWHEQREYSEQVNLGAIPDIAHLGVVYRALDSDDIDDPETWRKANPSLGVTISEEDFAGDLAEAKKVPVLLANFRRLRLNIIARGEGKFLPPGAWAACSGATQPHPKGTPAWLGLDLSSTNDLTALATIWGDPEDGFDVLMKFWLPSDNILELEHQHGVPYRTWADHGWIELTDGNVIDYAFIRRAINEIAGDFEVAKLLIDPFNARKLSIELKESDGLPVEEIRQGFLSLSAPTKELLRLVLSGRIRHSGNPILNWMAGNCVVGQDAAGNLKLSKKKARKKIDGMAALVNAIAGACESPEDFGSVYDTRGILTI